MAALFAVAAVKVAGDIFANHRHRRETRAQLEMARERLRVETEAREWAEKRKQEAEEAKERAERERQEAERAREEAEERAEKERGQREALEQLMRDLGMDPSVPEVSDEEVAAVRRAINYDPEKKNIAITGNLNAGKSALINALRDSVFGDGDYAPTGAAETTMERHRYPDPIHEGHIWYDTPGAGTPNVTAFGYYYMQKLFAYDMIVLAHESSLTESDVRLLQVCRLLEQPVVVARTKCDMHIRNYMNERGWTSDRSRIAFLNETRQDVRKFVSESTLTGAGVDPRFEDLVISASNVRRLVKGERSPVDAAEALVDESKFLCALGI
ncbi:hypothetical protein DL768_008711 [Monosporascus sp. mg162]|nr:hypothetical protein DL768_008711 [Monosporascus sp. mg162]